MKTKYLCKIMFLLCLGSLYAQSDSLQLIESDEYKTFSRIARSSVMNIPKEQAWSMLAPEVKTIFIKSTADSSDQPALFFNSGSDKLKPLLLVLHSWSADYQQHFSIPYGLWAVKNDWVFIHPDYRGPFDNPRSTASELAVQDILDALEYAKENALIDQSRIYITGFSGGGMATLIMVGRYPSLWSAAAAWVPVYDLAQWYQTTKSATHNYSKKIENSCGGPPLPGTEAFDECAKRSVSSYLQNARGEDIPVLIATGIRDVFVPPGHSLQAFNDLADKSDRIAQKDIDYINNHFALPPHLAQEHTEELFSDAGYRLLFDRSSAKGTLLIYDGNHDVIYNAGLQWLSRQKR